MPELLNEPFRVPGVGDKVIDEHVGRASTGDEGLSVAIMTAPAGWTEPGQRPEFDEVTVVLDGIVRVDHDAGSLDAGAGQVVLCRAGEWIRYSAPDGARYVAICTPAFSPETVHRDA